MQNIKSSEVWADKYRNESTDDSPYDIMADLWILAKLLYWEAQEPITPVLYNIPAFSKSKDTLNESKDSGGEWDGGRTVGWSTANNRNWWTNWWRVAWNGWWNGWWGGSVSLDWKTGQLDGVDNGDETTDISPIPLSSNINMDKGYDELVEWLDSYSVVNNDSEFYSSLCEDNNKEEEVEQKVEPSNWKTVSQVEDRIVSELTNQEYQELVDYMIEAVDNYTALPDDKEAEILQIAWDTTGFHRKTSPAELEETSNKIKNCWKSCDWLRIDQKASCYVKCACGEIKSPIFDPDKVPWLWPIFILKFCAVPAVNTKFSVWWKRIHSIEEWLNEIYGVVDKLAREWRLWKWTQQNEFLDSSTKQMNIWDTFAFTIDVEMVDIAGNPAKQSDQYKDKSMKTQNDNWKWAYFVSNHLNNPSTKNAFSVIGSQSSTGLNTRPEPLVDFIKDSGAYRYNLFEEHLGKWMDQQWVLWTQATEDISNFQDYSDNLYKKPCKKK